MPSALIFNLSLRHSSSTSDVVVVVLARIPIAVVVVVVFVVVGASTPVKVIQVIHLSLYSEDAFQYASP
jgi:hypothetical protein